MNYLMKHYLYIKTTFKNRKMCVLTEFKQNDYYAGRSEKVKLRDLTSSRVKPSVFCLNDWIPKTTDTPVRLTYQQAWTY